LHCEALSAMLLHHEDCEMIVTWEMVRPLCCKWV